MPRFSTRLHYRFVVQNKKIYLIAILAIMVIVGAGFLTPEKKAAEASDASRYTVSFNEAKDLGEIMRQIKKSGTSLVALRDSFTPLNGVTITDFYIIQQDKITRRAIIKDYKAARNGMIADLNKDANAIRANAPQIGSLQPTLPSFNPSDMTNSIEIEGVILRGSKDQVNEFSNSLGAKDIKLNRSKSGIFSSSESQVSSNSTVSVDPDTWAPRQGWLFTGDSSTAGERYATNYMWWDNVDGFSGQSFQTAYEHDFWLDISDGETYLDPSDTFINDYPNITYGASTLPSPYLDTRFMDPDNGELGYTIGSADANLITAGDQYYDYNYLRTLPGTANVDNAKVQAQFSEYISGYFLAPAFCIFSVSGTPIITLAPWNVPVPGSQFWSR